MNKIFLFLLSFSLLLSSKAQKIDDATAKAMVTKNAVALDLVKTNANDYAISSAYEDGGIKYLYLQQLHKGVPVRNQMKVLSFKGDYLSSNAGVFLSDVDKLSNNTSSIPTLKPADAVMVALVSERILITDIGFAKQKDKNHFDFGQPVGVTEKITGELLWYPIEVNGKIESIKLAWTVLVAPKGTDDMWQIIVDANSGKILGKFNYTIHEKSSELKSAFNLPSYLATPKQQLKTTIPSIDFLQPNKVTAVAGASYLVIPYPAESPIHPGGTAALRTNPWAAAVGNASTLGWHSDGAVDYTITRGNNVWATEDRVGSDQNTGLPAVSTTSPDPLTFNFPPNYTISPTNVAGFQRFATTNLFYWNNIMHDISYQYGFNEIAGNFQKNNQGRGGNGGDDVIALAQSGTGTNNANFSTPVDGGRPRMRMYLFDAAGTNIICNANTPASVAGSYSATESSFLSVATPATALANKLQDLGPITAPVVYFNDDAAGSTHFACGVPANAAALAGKIVMIDRGNGGICTNAAGVPFVLKVKNAQDAGALAVIMVNNTATPTLTIAMGGTDPTINIPAIMISQADGLLLAAQISNNLNITLAGIRFDGDVDNGVIAHEYGHGISTRLTGGPANSSCLGSNAPANNYCGNTRENGSEGWSDFFGLMVSTNWATAQLTDGVIPRSIGTYANGQTPSGAGFRIKPYSTNLTVNNSTYANVGDATYCGGIHNIGEIWCTAIWEMTWGIIQQEGSINPNLYNYTSTGNGGNIIAMKLVTEGLKLQPCSPGFVDQRDAILAADRLFYNGRHACAMWTAFAKRGLGYGASQGSSNSVLDQTASSALPPAPGITTQPVDATSLAGANASFSTVAALTDVNLIYNWQVSTDGGTTWNNVSPAVITPTLTLTAVTAGMNNNKYRCQVFIGCDISTTTNATLIVTGGVVPPTITTQPTNTSVCAGANAIFTAVASGTGNTYSWEVSTNGGTTWAAIIPAATTPTLTLTAVTTAMHNNKYRLVVTNSSGNVTTNDATLIVNALPATPTVISPIVYCQGATPIALTATGANLMWYTVPTAGTGSTTAPTPSTSASGNTIYYVSQTVNGCEGPRAAITVTVNATPSEPITAPLTYCQNAPSVALTATGTNLMWYTVPTAGTGSTTAPTPSTTTVGTTTYYVSQTINGCEGPRATLVVSVAAIPAAPTVTPTATYCQGVTAIALTAIGTNLQWYTVPSLGTGSTAAPTPSTTTIGSTNYYVSQTVGTCESPRALITVTVVAGTLAPIVVTPIAYCQGATSIALTATGANLLWYTVSSGGVSSTTAPTPSTGTGGSITYYVSQTIGTCESPRAAIVVNVTTLPAAPLVTTPVTYCEAATAVALTATGTNLLWYTTSTGGSGSATAPIPVTGTIGSTSYYVSQSTASGCEGPRATIVVNITAIPAAPSATTAFSYCQGVAAPALTAIGSNLLWYTVATGGTSSAIAPIPNTSTVGTITYYVSQTTGCEGPRTAIVVTTLAGTAVPAVITPIIYCQNATSVALAATGTGLLWYTVALGGTSSATAPIPSTSTAGSTTYYVSQTIGTCESPRASIVVTVNATPALPTIATPLTYCIGATAPSLTATGTGLMWYATLTGGVGSTTAPLPSTSTVGSTIYYVSQTINGCEGARAALTVIVNALPTAPTAITPITYCQGATSTALVATGSNILWYSSITGGVGSTTAPIPSTTGVGSITYYASQTITGCEGPRVAIVVNVNAAPAAPTVTTPLNYCENIVAPALTAVGTNLLWYTTLTGGTSSTTAPIPSTTSTGSITYYVSQSIATCESPRAAIVVNVAPVPVITTQPVAAVTCGGGNASFSAVVSGTGLTYQWQIAPNCGSIFSNIPGATSPTLNLTNVSTTQNGFGYRLVISGTCIPTTLLSNCVNLTINAASNITLQPVDATICSGNPATFTTLATGASVTYQWQISTDGGTTFTNITGATNASYTLPNVTVAMGGTRYRALVSSTCAANTPSSVAILTVPSTPAIITQPLDIISCTPTATFSSIVTGSGITYQWQISTDAGANYSDIPGANSGVYTISGLSPAQSSYKYRLFVTSTLCGSVISNSVSAKLGLSPVVVLTSAPLFNFNPSTFGGLYTTVSPVGTYTYQWKRNNTILTNTGTSITKANGLLDIFGTYQVIVTDPATNCAGVSNTVTVSDIEAERNNLFVAPNPTTGLVRVTYYSSNATAPQARIINIYDEKGARVFSKLVTLVGSYGSTTIDISKYPASTYIFVIRDAEGKKLSQTRVVKY
jgi:Fungalysin metallopeptidase (M36)/PA domain/Ig-like domain CHU_C associated